eukprot:comp4054_c0_seq1/m.2421 comp4054_c0_seq1/g.2421  ORF comp4054_c0_seq1/g.2421 comp4054_c0_seq1/m.2421 type:complete len:127 (+) comp4054_c0_seq1:74-454(+)
MSADLLREVQLGTVNTAGEVHYFPVGATEPWSGDASGLNVVSSGDKCSPIGPVLETVFRGRQMYAVKLGADTLVVSESGEKEDCRWKVEQLNDGVTYWLHDQVPTRTDPLCKTFDIFTLADMIHAE